VKGIGYRIKALGISGLPVSNYLCGLFQDYPKDQTMMMGIFPIEEIKVDVIVVDPFFASWHSVLRLPLPFG